MPQFSTTRRVRHSAADMFDLVADVESYPAFVPLCQSLAVRKRSKDGEGRDVIVADMTVAYKLIRETFTSRVTLDRGKREIMVEYLEGPFRKLSNRWSFHPDGDRTCEVEFFIAYEFRIVLDVGDEIEHVVCGMPHLPFGRELRHRSACRYRPCRLESRKVLAGMMG